MRSGSPAISGASVRPSALVTVSFSSARALAPISCRAILTPGAGRPATVSSTWVESRPVVTGTPGPSTSATRRSRVIRPISSQRRVAFGLGVMVEPALELAQDRIPGVAADADDEGKAEFLPVGGVEPVEAVELLGAQPVEAEPALFGLGMPR